MDYSGKGKKGILNIGEAPGEIEDRRGKQWQGKMGRVLKRTYRRLGVDLFEDCWNINTINCRPTDEKGNNRPPTDDEIACCRRRVLKVIDQLKPKVIVLLGGAAVKCLIGYRWKKDLGGISKWRGWTIPDRDFNAWVCPVFHPSYVERQSKYPEVETVWMQDLERALDMVNKPFPSFRNESELVEIVESPRDIRLVLRDLRRARRMVAFDFEATGLKPHNTKKHQIVCVSFCNNSNRSFSIPWPEDRKQIARFRWLLEDADVPKVAHNMKFEWTWANVLHKILVNPFVWDSMQAAHVLDNRPGITSLKFQTCINFGVYDYDSEVESYLKGTDPRNANSVNRIMELWNTRSGREKLLTYCGMDALYTYRLARRQMEEMGFIYG